MISALHPRFRDVPRVRRRLDSARVKGAGLDTGRFRTSLASYPTGVAVVTTARGGDPVGMTVGTFTSISLDPPLVGFFANSGSGTVSTIVAAGAFAVNVLDADGEALGREFSRPCADRFDGVAWTRSPLGSPLLDTAVLVVDCELDEMITVGDHVLVVGRVESCDSDPAKSDPLIFHRATFTTTRSTP